ncbi:GNAT family N-acetyltransferase [Roseibium sp.]|uniref:GNAT family N-acetyltransferase n=1 Tax=Roseibium sp. TaxID=1936156 RepID=UPI003BB1713B
MIDIVEEVPAHAGAREALLDLCFGDERFTKTSERLREGRLPVFAFSALDESGRLVGTVRLWSVADRNGKLCLLLGPLAVDPACRGSKVGDRLMRHALNQCALHGHGSVILVGDLPYYTRFGFEAGRLDEASLPGPVSRERFLGLEFAAGHLAGLNGPLSAAGLADLAGPTAATQDLYPVSKLA